MPNLGPGPSGTNALSSYSNVGTAALKLGLTALIGVINRRALPNVSPWFGLFRSSPVDR
jgi:hypothetical protein